MSSAAARKADEFPAPAPRVRAIDIVRGAVMVLMAIDHVRVYSGVPAGGPEPAIFFTRWVTHFCAPAFAFLAGTSAYLYGRKLDTTRALSGYLLRRGLLLVAMEWTVLRFAWTFNFDYAHFLLAGVIWMLGWSMVAMSGLVWLPARAVGAIGLAIVFGQQIFRHPPLWFPKLFASAGGWLWEFIYPAGLKPPFAGLAILYVLVPWVGVMAAGYAFGEITRLEPARRRRLCLAIGGAATAAFLIFGILLLPPARDSRPFLLRLLDQRKYPASQLYLLMTLGPTIIALALAEAARGWLGRALATFGRGPMFYYLAHIPLIHLAALGITWARQGRMHPEWYTYAPFTSVPPDQRWGLPLLYLVFGLLTVLLFFACRWFGDFKARRRWRWLRYI